MQSCWNRRLCYCMIGLISATTVLLIYINIAYPFLENISARHFERDDNMQGIIAAASHTILRPLV